MTPQLLAFHMPFMDQSAVLLVVALLIFGKRLPEVGKSLGKGIVEFKRGLKGIEDEVEEASNVPAGQYKAQQATAAAAALPAATATAYKFDPHTGQPVEPPAPTGAKFDPYTGKPIATGPLQGEIVTESVHAPVTA